MRQDHCRYFHPSQWRYSEMAYKKRIAPSSWDSTSLWGPRHAWVEPEKLSLQWYLSILTKLTWHLHESDYLPNTYFKHITFLSLPNSIANLCCAECQRPLPAGFFTTFRPAILHGIELRLFQLSVCWFWQCLGGRRELVLAEHFLCSSIGRHDYAYSVNTRTLDLYGMKRDASNF